MDNSVGWRSWPYYLDPKTMTEIELGADCTMRTLKILPKHKRRTYITVEDRLTTEQEFYVVEGFR